MKKILLLTALSLILPFNLLSQWKECIKGMNQEIIDIRALLQVGDNILASTTYYYPPFIGKIFISTDNGDSWQQEHTDMVNYQINSFVISGNRILAGFGNTKTLNGGILISTDNGQTWTEQIDKNNKSYIFKLAVNGNFVFASTMNGVFVSTDYGDTWTSKNVNLPLSTRIWSLATSGNRVYAGTEQHGLYRSLSADYWNYIGNFTDIDIYTSIYSICASGTDVYVGTGKQELLYSNDYGSTWTKSDLITSEPIDCIVNKDDTLYGGSNVGVFCSTDKFKTWTNYTAGRHFTGSSSILLKDGYCFAGGSNLYRAKIKDLFDKHQTIFSITFKDKYSGDSIPDLGIFLLIRDQKNNWDVLNWYTTDKKGSYHLDTRGSLGPFMITFSDTSYAPSSLFVNYDDLMNLSTIELEKIPGIPVYINSLDGKEKDMALVQCPVTITAEINDSTKFGIDSTMKTIGYISGSKLLYTKIGEPMALILPPNKEYTYRLFGIDSGSFVFDVWKSTLNSCKHLTYSGNILKNSMAFLTLNSDTSKNDNKLFIDFNSDGSADTFLLPIVNTTETIDEFYPDAEELSLQPCPANDKVFINGLSNGVKIYLYNFLGIKIYEGDYNNYIDVSEFEKGLYYIKARNKTYKLMKL